MSDEKAVVKVDPLTAQVNYVEKRIDRVEAAMCAIIKDHITPEQLIYQLKTAIAKTPKLAQCNRNSVLDAIIQAVSVGLDFSGSNDEGYLVPFYDKKAGGYQCVFVPGYKGLVLNLHRCGVVRDVDAHVVLEGDEFEFEYGTNARLRHVPKRCEELLDPKATWARITHAYALAELPHGRIKFRVVPKEYLERVRASASGQSLPWIHWPEPMACKTAIKQLRKVLPIDGNTIIGRTFAIEKGVDELTVDAEVADEGLSTADKVKLALGVPSEAGPDPEPDEKGGEPEDGRATVEQPESRGARPRSLPVALDRLYTAQPALFEEEAARLGVDGIQIDDMADDQQVALYRAIYAQLKESE